MREVILRLMNRYGSEWYRASKINLGKNEFKLILYWLGGNGGIPNNEESQTLEAILHDTGSGYTVKLLQSKDSWRKLNITYCEADAIRQLLHLADEHKTKLIKYGDLDA